MHRRTTLIMRALALGNILEGAVGLFLLSVMTTTAIQPVARAVLTELPASPITIWTGVAVDIGFLALLLVSAHLLWNLRRSGLSLLAWTLGGEAFLFIALTVLQGLFSLRTEAGAQAAAGHLQSVLFMLSFVFGFQMITAYPLVAGVLVVLAFRALRNAGDKSAALESQPHLSP